MNTARRPTINVPAHHTGPCLGCGLGPAVNGGLCAICDADVMATVDLRNLAAIDAARDADDAARFCFGDDEGLCFLAGIRA